MSAWLAVLSIWACQDPVTLDSLETAKASLKNESGFMASVAPVRKVNDGVVLLANQDKLKTGTDFRRAASLYTVLNWDFDDARQRYELTLTAFALGDLDAERSLPMDWDSLLITTGRKQRLGSMRMPPEFQSAKFDERPAPKVVQTTLTAPAKARETAKSAKDDPKMQATVDADQKDREGDWTKISQADLLAVMKRDRERMAWVKAAVETGNLHTAQDFFNAALVLQHGEVAGDFALSHELCLCAVALGDTKDARWLAAASYDRMMRNLGHHQRFATQYGAEGLQKVDTDGINDTMRKALHCPTLEAARKRVMR